MNHSSNDSSKFESLTEGERGSCLAGIKILLAEDSPDCQLLMKVILGRLGAIVDVVADGEDAFRQATQNIYDVILMDIQMPNLNGYEATRRLRASGCTFPILALTAHAMKEERKKCLEAGCNDHLTKPIRAGQLVGAILKYATRLIDGRIH